MTTNQYHIHQIHANRDLAATREEVLFPLDLITPEWLILGYIYEHSGCSVGQVAKALQVQSTYVTSMVRRLETKLAGQFITVTEGRKDRRIRELRVTGLGADIYRQSEAKMVKATTVTHKTEERT